MQHNGGDRTSETKEREKAVRKLVRVIIEKNGGNGAEVKADIDTNYPRGIVWWKDQRVGQWDNTEQRMVLKGAAVDYQSTFTDLMK